MDLDFKSLCTKLDINPERGDEAQLMRLKQWCNDRVSRDMVYEGNPLTQYKQYLAMAEHYLDKFLPYTNGDPGENVPELHNINPIQYAAYCGFDHYLDSLSPRNDGVFDKPVFGGATPLHLAASKGHVHAVQALLDHGASPDKANNDSQYPVYSALKTSMLHDVDLMSRKEHVFRLLKLSAPTTLAHQDDSGDSVFHLMAINGFSAILSEALQEYGPGASISNNASRYPIHSAILNNQLDSARILLQLDSVSSLADAHGRTALHYAARSGKREMIELCCDKTTDLNIRDSSNKTPLMLATEAKNIDAMAILTRRGADARLTDYKGFNLLHYAVLSNDMNTVRWVLDHTTIDIDSMDARGHSPLIFTKDRDEYHEIRMLLLERGAHDIGSTPLYR